MAIRSAGDSRSEPHRQREMGSRWPPNKHEDGQRPGDAGCQRGHFTPAGAAGCGRSGFAGTGRSLRCRRCPREAARHRSARSPAPAQGCRSKSRPSPSPNSGASGSMVVGRELKVESLDHEFCQVGFLGGLDGQSSASLVLSVPSYEAVSFGDAANQRSTAKPPMLQSSTKRRHHGWLLGRYATADAAGHCIPVRPLSDRLCSNHRAVRSLA